MIVQIKNIKTLVLCSILLLFTTSHAIGQINNAIPFELKYKIKEDKVLLRICPTSAQIWELGNQYGYTIEKLPQGSATVTNSVDLKPAEFEAWQPFIEVNDYFMSASSFIHIDKIDPSIMEEDFPSSEYTEEDILDIRFMFTRISVDYDFKVAQMAGLGFEDTYQKADATFRYKVMLNDPSKQYIQTIEIQPSKFVAPTPPTIETTGDHKRVYINWATKAAKKDFHSYHLQFSDNNIDFKNKFDIPYLDMADTLNQIVDKDVITLHDTISNNNENRWYRIKGIDYFGDLSEPSPVVVGSGIDLIEIAPFFTDGIQTEENEAVLTWEVQPEYAHLIDYFILSHADSVDAPYKNITNLPADARTFTTRMEYASNYFLLTTVPKGGKSIHSYPIMVMAYDADPPLKPIGLVGVVDTNGIVSLNWTANTDEDLKGYEVFKKDFDSSEFYQLSTHPVLDTIFTDTLSLKLSIDQVFYTIAAIDKRHNQSEFADTLKLIRPDINPPVEPHIYNINAEKDSIVLQWHNSSSEDVASQQLFRRAIDAEEEWTLLDSFSIENLVTEYVDFNVLPKVKYAYILVATDDAGLTSPPSQPVVTKTVSYQLRPEIISFEANQPNSKNEVTLSWDYEPNDVYDFWLYKRRIGTQLSLYKKLDGNNRSFKDDELKSNNQYEYYIKAYFKDGTNSPFSQKLLVELKGE